MAVTQQQRIIRNHEMLDVIRLRKQADSNVESLKDDLKISRPAADKMYAALSDGREGAPLIERQDRRIKISGGEGLFLGVSIGSSHIRVSVVDLNFEPLSPETLEEVYGLKGLREFEGFEEKESKNDGYSYKTPHQSENAGGDFFLMQQLVSSIVSTVLDHVSVSSPEAPFPLMGIGFAVAGPVDFEEKKWYSAPRFTTIRNLSLIDLMGYDNYSRANSLSLFLSIDNNAKTSMISEYQYLLEGHSGVFQEDLALLYVGTGLSLSFVMDGQLLRGRRNLGGEAGHIRVPVKSPSGSITFQNTLEGLLKGPYSPGQNASGNLSYVEYLPYVLNMITCILGIENIVLVGHSINQYLEDVVSQLMTRRIEYTVDSTQLYCRPMNGRRSPNTAAIGAAIESYFSMCGWEEGANQEEYSSRINLTKDIVWPKLS